MRHCREKTSEMPQMKEELEKGKACFRAAKKLASDKVDGQKRSLY